jgi:hypothetical protein
MSEKVKIAIFDKKYGFGEVELVEGKDGRKCPSTFNIATFRKASFDKFGNEKQFVLKSYISNHDVKKLIYNLRSVKDTDPANYLEKMLSLPSFLPVHEEKIIFITV